MLRKFLMIGVVFLLIVSSVHAVDSSKPNNKFGISLVQPDTENIEKAAQLVNTNGDWGYITLIIQENDRDKGKWQTVFDQLRRLHLIPIIRIATQPEGVNWRRPNPEDADAWVDFLNSLNWVVKNRYVVLFNEPNHATEWGGSVDSESYKNITLLFARKLKDKNKDFAPMLAGLDASAPSGMPNYEDEETFLDQIFTEDSIKDWNGVLYGWASHSYPNPGFVGSPYGLGRGSIRTYQWELQVLSQLGVKDLPVFITETGWDGQRISRDGVADHFQTAFTNIWLPDDRIVAVTPFVLDYQTDPFLNFSWKMQGTDQFYPQYYTIQALEKTKGTPDQYDKGEIVTNLPKELVVHSRYHFKIDLLDNGQAYWDQKFGYKVRLENASDVSNFINDVTDIQPFQKGSVELFLNTVGITGVRKVKISLINDNDKSIAATPWNFSIIPLPSLSLHVSLYPRLRQKGNDFEVQVFDDKNQIIYKRKNVAVEHALGKAGDIANIVPGDRYRVVLLKPYYLPRQAFVRFHKGENDIVFKRMYPLDFDKDGALTVKDIGALIQNPHLLSLLLP